MPNLLEENIKRLDNTIEFLQKHELGKVNYVDVTKTKFCIIGAFGAANDAASYEIPEIDRPWYTPENKRIRELVEFIAGDFVTDFNDREETTKEDIIELLEKTKVALSKEYVYNTSLT